MQLRKDFEFPFHMLLCLLVAFLVVYRFVGKFSVCVWARYIMLLLRLRLRTRADQEGNRLIRYSLHFDHSRTEIVVLDRLTFRHSVNFLSGGINGEIILAIGTSK